MSTLKTENFLSMDKKEMLRPNELMFIEEWLKDHSHDLGPSAMKRKLDQLLLRMGYWVSNSVKLFQNITKGRIIYKSWLISAAIDTEVYHSDTV